MHHVDVSGHGAFIETYRGSTIISAVALSPDPLRPNAWRPLPLAVCSAVHPIVISCDAASPPSRELLQETLQGSSAESSSSIGSRARTDRCAWGAEKIPPLVAVGQSERGKAGDDDSTDHEQDVFSVRLNRMKPENVEEAFLMPFGVISSTEL